jgi:hypothetical protein
LRGTGDAEIFVGSLLGDSNLKLELRNNVRVVSSKLSDGVLYEIFVDISEVSALRCML